MTANPPGFAVSAQERARQRMRRRLKELTGSQPLILCKAVIAMDAALLVSGTMARRYNIISTAGRWQGRPWYNPGDQEARIDDVYAAYFALPAGTQPLVCRMPGCGKPVTNPNRAAHYCSLDCQRKRKKSRKEDSP